ncbi:MAG: pyridoxal-phosphate dependent enzyme [Candidatus Acidiferrum sp.]
MSTSSSHFTTLIDTKYAAEKSIVLRYRNAFTFGAPEQDRQFKELLAKTSIQEGARIFSFLNYKGVEIYLLDETSLMYTRTLKSIDGCVTTAKCKQAGLDKVVLETGGNTGSALTAYGTRAGLETYCFIPHENIDLLESKFFASPRAHLISVEDPGMVKKATHLFEALFRLKHIPETTWRYEASRFRGLFILEHMLEKMKFDWIAQTISAAFGPIGIYWAFKNRGKGLGRTPRFLGVQQEANCPMYRAWKAKRQTLRALKVDSTSKLLTRVMYDVKPHTYGTYKDLLDVLQDSDGKITTINRREFAELLEMEFDGVGVRGLLRSHGIDIGDQVVEKTGLIALAGALKAIDKGEIPKGKRVLSCLTSGAHFADGQAKPEFTISSLHSMMVDYGRQLALGATHG